MAKIFIVGFPYIRERYFATWRIYPKQGDISFLLPHRWPAKEGKVIFSPPPDKNIETTKTLFSHSHTPFIGGLLKGWMPAFPLYLWRHRKTVQLVYSCSEPILLTTLYQAVWTKLFGKKHICFSWENIPYEKKLRGFSYVVHRFILSGNLFLSDGLICGNQDGVDLHRRFTKKPIALVPMSGVDPEKFVRPVSEQKLFSHYDWSGKILYTYLGAIGYRKGIHFIIEAMPLVVEKVPNALLVIAGSGEYEKEIEQAIEKSSVRDHIVRLPWLDDHDVRKLLSISDVFLYPSFSHKGWAEQFGYSMAEASLMEVPVIATRSSSVSNVILDGKTGMLLPPGDSSALTSAMITLGCDPLLRMALGIAGRAYIEGHFSHQVVAKQFQEFFERILAA